MEQENKWPSLCKIFGRRTLLCPVVSENFEEVDGNRIVLKVHVPNWDKCVREREREKKIPLKLQFGFIINKHRSDCVLTTEVRSEKSEQKIFRPLKDWLRLFPSKPSFPVVELIFSHRDAGKRGTEIDLFTASDHPS